MMKKDLAILLPARNEEGAINRVVVDIVDMLRYIPRGYFVGLYVLDGASSDGTILGADGFNKISVSPGKGNGIREGLTKIDADYYIMLDSDGSYCTEYIPPIIKQLEDGADYVMGARLLQEQGSMPFGNGLGNRLITGLANRLYHASIKDLCTGMIGFNRKVRHYLVDNLTSQRFTLEAEMFTHAVRQNWAIAQVAVRYCPRVGKRHINRLDHLRILWYLVNNAKDKV